MRHFSSRRANSKALPRLLRLEPELAHLEQSDVCPCAPRVRHGELQPRGVVDVRVRQGVEGLHRGDARAGGLCRRGELLLEGEPVDNGSWCLNVSGGSW